VRRCVARSHSFHLFSLTCTERVQSINNTDEMVCSCIMNGLS
jgi:hypothetical protein